MRFAFVAALLLTTAQIGPAQSGRAEWLGASGQRVKAKVFRSADAGTSPVLVVILHGDLDASYHYEVASAAAKHIDGIVAAALVRPGYTDNEGDTSDGMKGQTDGDNYTPAVLNQLDAAIRQLKAELKPSSTVLVGHSGGAAISADLIAKDRTLANAALLASCVCDLPVWRKHMKTMYPNPNWDDPVTSVSPIDVVDRIDPKTRVVLAVGEKDTTAPPSLTEEYAAALRKHGIEPKVNVLPGMDHNRIMFSGAVMQELSALVGEVRSNHQGKPREP